MRVTKQGVRDLNPPGYNGRQSKAATVTCAHVWEYECEWDCWLDAMTYVRRCGFCQEVRR
jgi:hypothetical protein